MQKNDSGNANIAVSSLHQWINELRAMGQPKDAENLIMMTFAAQTNRTFFRHGGPWDVTLLNIPDDCELRETALPSPQQWDVAQLRALTIFQFTRSPLRSANSVMALQPRVRADSVCESNLTRGLPYANNLISLWGQNGAGLNPFTPTAAISKKPTGFITDETNGLRLTTLNTARLPAAPPSVL